MCVCVCVCVYVHVYGQDGPLPVGVPPPPKFFSDVFESIAGAVVLDGGQRALQETFGPILVPFVRAMIQRVRAQSAVGTSL